MGYTLFCSLTRYCNFHCAYCWSYAHTDQRLFRPKDVITAKLDATKEAARRQGFTAFTIALNGGESTQHPDCLAILRHLAADTVNCQRQTLHLTTNLSRGTIWWLEFLLATKPFDHVTVSASWHQAMHLDGFVEKRRTFADKVALLKANDVETLITIVMVPESWDAMLSDADYFRSLGFHVGLQPLITEKGQYAESYTAEMLAVIKSPEWAAASPDDVVQATEHSF